MFRSYIIRCKLILYTACLFTLGSCQPEQPKLSLGSVIRQSFISTQDSVFLPAPTGTEGLLIRGTNLDLDFGGAYLIGANFGAAPDLQTGTALKVEKAKTLKIRNAHFLGFQIGIHIQELDTLILENCHFDHFRRSGMANNPELTSIGLLIEKAKYVILQNSSWQRMDLGLRTQEAPTIQIQECSFLWINSNALQMAQSNILKCSSSLFAYIGLPSNSADLFHSPGTKVQLQGNHLAHCRFRLEDLPDLSLDNNSVAYTEFVPEDKWQRPQLDQLLLQKGISTPSLSLIDQWGWYDFSYPKAWFRQGSVNTDVYLLTAPSGNWRVIDGFGYSRIIPKTGAFPSTVQAEFAAKAEGKYLGFEFLGKPLKRFGKPFYSKEVFTFKAQANEEDENKH